MVTTNHYDVIIIGTGAGGGALAYKLAPSGKRILLLERGDYLPRETENWISTSVFIQNRYVAQENWYDERGKVSARHDQFVERFRDAYRAELQAFVDALHAGTDPTPGIDDGLQAVRIAAAATRSRREGRWIAIAAD